MQTIERTETGHDLRVLAAARTAVRPRVVAKVNEPPPIWRFVDARMQARGLHPAELARLADVDRGVLSNLKKGTYNPGIHLLAKLAPHLGVSLGRLLVEAGMATEEDLEMAGLPPVMVMMLERINDPELKPRHRRALLNHLSREIPRVFETFDEVLAEVEPYLQPKWRARQ